jgi:hypothetical protein
MASEQQRNVSGSDRIRALQAQLLTQQKPGADRPLSTALAGLRAVNSKSATSTSPASPRKAPNYQPGSQEQFLARLKTFADVKKWGSKPDAIGEVEWAKRGWSCDAWNTVACKGGCEQRVAVKLRPKRKSADGKEIEMSEDLGADVGEGLVERYKALIVEGHGEDCLWRRRGCSDEIYHIPIPNRSKSSAELLERYKSFKVIEDEIPLIENILYPEPSISDVLKRVPSTLWNSPGSQSTQTPPTTPSEISAFAFAIFGWTGLSDSKIALATCGHCFQRLGLWLYKEDRLKDMSEKLEVPIESLRLNLLEAHREHCPWKNPVTQLNPVDGPIKDMAAWQTLEFLLMGRKKREEPPQHRHHQSVASIDMESYRDSMDSEGGMDISGDKRRSGGDADSLNEKWKRFKAKLKRTTSRKSLRSTKSIKSAKSVKSVDLGRGKDKENEKTTQP